MEWRCEDLSVPTSHLRKCPHALCKDGSLCGLKYPAKGVSVPWCNGCGWWIMNPSLCCHGEGLRSPPLPQAGSPGTAACADAALAMLLPVIAGPHCAVASPQPPRPPASPPGAPHWGRGGARIRGEPSSGLGTPFLQNFSLCTVSLRATV